MKEENKAEDNITLQRLNELAEIVPIDKWECQTHNPIRHNSYRIDFGGGYNLIADDTCRGSGVSSYRIALFKDGKWLFGWHEMPHSQLELFYNKIAGAYERKLSEKTKSVSLAALNELENLVISQEVSR